jgi:hypothetical protein
MKILKYLSICSLLLLFTVGCEKGIDPITAVPQGTDELAPTLTITFPVEGKPVTSKDEVAQVFFKMVAEDDIELASVKIDLDGTEIGNLTSFKDYRRAVIAYEYNSLVDGDHTLTVNVTDKTGKLITKTIDFKKITVPPYTPKDGEVFYLPFEDNFLEVISSSELTVIGAPGFTAGKIGQAFAGATDAYLTFPTAGLLGNEFSLAFWYKINAVPDRAGILAISATGDDRTTGLRLFREVSGDKQNIGLNIGITTSEVWMNPFVKVSPTEDWIHIAISISTTHATIYVNGSPVADNDIASKLDWTGCSSMSIGSGAPNFTYWNHFSDLSLFDELHIFNKAISANEVNAIFTGKK